MVLTLAKTGMRQAMEGIDAAPTTQSPKFVAKGAGVDGLVKHATDVIGNECVFTEDLKGLCNHCKWRFSSYLLVNSDTSMSSTSSIPLTTMNHTYLQSTG